MRLFRFILNRHRAAMRWTGMILIQASSAARRSAMVAVPQMHPHKEETWMNFYTHQHKHHCGIDLHARVRRAA